MEKKIYILSFLFIIHGVVYSQFTGFYAPANWATTLSAGSGGTVNTSGAPASIKITGSDTETGGSNVDVDFTIAAKATGAWSFSWSYQTSDGPSTDPAYVLKNGVLTLLTTNSGGQNQTGTYNGMATLGDVIGFKVRATDNCCGSAAITISSFVPPAGVLPIKLISFTANPEKIGVKLNWTTSMEIDNDRFEIEKSINGIDFTKIGTIKSLGNTNQIENYSFTDFAARLTDVYYRLRHFDKDDKVYVSNIVTCSFKAENLNTIYPNPSSNTVYLKIGNPNSLSTETIRLFSSDFSLIEMRVIKLQNLRDNAVSWDISRLPTGHYFFKLEKSGAIMSLIKQ